MDPFLRYLERPDRRRYARFVVEYMGPVARLARRLAPSPDLADDIVQDTFVRLGSIEKASEEISDPRAYVLRTALNIARAQAAREAARDRREERAVQLRPREAPPVTKELMDEEAVKVLYNAMDSLPEDLRIAIHLRAVEGLSYREIAEVTGASLSAVGMRIQRARAELKRLLERAGLAMAILDFAPLRELARLSASCDPLPRHTVERLLREVPRSRGTTATTAARILVFGAVAAGVTFFLLSERDRGGAVDRQAGVATGRLQVPASILAPGAADAGTLAPGRRETEYRLPPGPAPAAVTRPIAEELPESGAERNSSPVPTPGVDAMKRSLIAASIGLSLAASTLAPGEELGDVNGDGRVSFSDAYRLWRWLATGIDQWAPAPGSSEFEPEIRCTHQFRDVTALVFSEAVRRAGLHAGREPLPHLIERWPAPSADLAEPPPPDPSFRLEVLPVVQASGEGTAELRVRLDAWFPVDFVALAIEIDGLDARPPHPIEYGVQFTTFEPSRLWTSTEYYLLSGGALVWHTDALRALPSSLPKFTLEAGSHEFSLPIVLPRDTEPGDYEVRLLPGSELVTSFGELVTPELVGGSLRVSVPLDDREGHVHPFPPLQIDEESRSIGGRAELRFTEAEGFPGDVVTVRAQLRTERPINRLKLRLGYDFRALELVDDGTPLYRDAESGEVEVFDHEHVPLLRSPYIDSVPSFNYRYYPFTFLNPERLTRQQLSSGRVFSVHSNEVPPSIKYLQPFGEWIDLFELRFRILERAAGLGEAAIEPLVNTSQGVVVAYAPYAHEGAASMSSGCPERSAAWWTYEPLEVESGRIRILGGGEPPVFDPPVPPEVARIQFTAGDRDDAGEPVEIAGRRGQRIEVPLYVATGTVLAKVRAVLSFDTSRLEFLGFDAHFIDFDGATFFAFLDASIPPMYGVFKQNTQCFTSPRDCQQGLFPDWAALHAGREEVPPDSFIVDVQGDVIDDVFFQPARSHFLGNAILRVLDDAPPGRTEVPGTRVTWKPFQAIFPIESESSGMPPYVRQEDPVEVWIPAEVHAAVVRILAPGDEPEFLRGDTDRNEALELTDAVGLLASLFGGGGEVPCQDAADANDDGSLDLSDASYSLGYLFSGGAVPPEPFPAPGIDPTADDLGCER